jgi:hypothetical protein
MKTTVFFIFICSAFFSFSQEMEKKLTITIKPNSRENSFQRISNERSFERKELKAEKRVEVKNHFSERRIRPHFDKQIEHPTNEREIHRKDRDTRKERIRERKENRLEILRNRRN